MQYINPNQENIKSALETHVRKLLPVLNERIENCTNDFLKTFFTKYIELLLKSNPRDLIHLQKILFRVRPDFKIYLRDKRRRKAGNFSQDIRDEYKPYLDEINKIIDYDDFINKTIEPNEYDAYRLAENLNINTCAYCNRLYTKTVINETENGKISKLTRPTFDHWFPQSKNPILALSFYNLIPSCNVCNSSLKSSTDMTLENNLHPYINQDINFQFSYKLNSIDKYDFTIKNIGDDLNTKSKNTADFFKLKEIYETHINEVEDLLKIKKAYSVTYLKSMKAFFKDSSGLSNEEVYRLAFGTEINESKFERRPLSRMKRDILIELGIIRK